MATNEEKITAYFAENQILIADTVSSARVNVASQLLQLGAKRPSMNLVSTYEEAQTFIRSRKPKIILCDYALGNKSGLDLLQDQRSVYDAQEIKSCLFVLVTGNGSQSAVARAAEEDVDTFIIKPFTLKSFRKNLSDAIIAKLTPSPYLLKIDEGKEFLFKGQTDAAVKCFQDATQLTSSPTLAYFYLAQAKVMKSAIGEAEGSYSQGLAYNQIHYKCLVGLYELFMKEQKPREAYGVVKRIAQYFPANPKRLSAVLRLAVTTEGYDDIEGFYKLFIGLDERPDELVRYMCSALAITAKYHLNKKDPERALSFFEKVAISCAGRTSFLRYIVENLIEAGLTSEAMKYLKRFDAQTHTSEDYLVSSYQIIGATRDPGQVAEYGRILLSKGYEFEGIYKVLIRASREAGMHDFSQNLIEKVEKKWPALT